MIIVSRVFSRRKRFRAFGRQPARVSRKRPFPESFRVFPRPSIYPFVKAKPVSTLVFKWKSCFHNSLEKHYICLIIQVKTNYMTQALAAWYEMLASHFAQNQCELMCVKILYEHHVRVATRKRLLENKWFVRFTQDCTVFVDTEVSINIHDFVSAKFHSFLV